MDPRLIQRCQAGDELAWEALVRAQQGRVYAVACHYLRDADEARDLAQEILVRVWQRLPQLEDPERFVSWMLSIARNAAIDRVRRRKARPPAQDIPAEDMVALEDPGPAPDADAESGSARRMVHRAIDSLGEIHREMLLLREIQGLSLEEVGRVLGLPVGTVKSRSNRARLELANALSGLLGTKEEMR